MYLVPVSAPYQFQQEISKFKEKYGVEGDNEAIKNMSYMQKKMLVAGDFGVLKAQRNVASLITNKVDDDGVTNRAGKGAQDEQILAKAIQLEKDGQESKKQGESGAQYRRQAYSKEGLLPDSMLSQIPYKETYEALQKEDNDERE